MTPPRIAANARFAYIVALTIFLVSPVPTTHEPTSQSRLFTRVARELDRLEVKTKP
jgi:hypothetical protein